MSPFRESAPAGLSIFDTASGSFKGVDRSTGESKDISGAEIKKIVEAKPGLAKKLEELMNPDLSSNEFLEVVGELNDEFGFTEERKGMYEQVEFNLPCRGTLNVKVFTDMENSLSFSGSAF